MGKIETAHHILLQNPIRNYCAIRLLSLMENPDIAIENRTVLITDKSTEGKFSVFVPSGPSGNKDIFAKIPTQPGELFIIDDWPLEYILPNQQLSRDLDCYQLHLPDDVVLPEDDARICDIGIEHAAYIYTNYDSHEFTTQDYIDRQIQSGPAIGIIENERLIAWAMTHEEGSMGFLTVLPEYRRQGLGARLTTALSRRIRQADGIPTVHIVKTNQASLAMAKKNGFIHNANVHWLLS
jgi:ribosomal protein S18 acetylase RimI-like enzyme